MPGKLIILLLTGLTFLALMGCSTGANMVKVENIGKADLSRQGLILVSGASSEQDTEVTLYVKNKKDNKSYFFTVNPVNTGGAYFFVGPVVIQNRNFTNGGYISFLLPEGEYKVEGALFEWFFLGSKQNQKLFFAENNFNVKTNTITYIGSYDISIKRNVLNILDSAIFKNIDTYEALTNQMSQSKDNPAQSYEVRKELVELTALDKFTGKVKK